MVASDASVKVNLCDRPFSKLMFAYDLSETNMSTRLFLAAAKQL